jgi:glycosyltransferase involved in cell wall biosynthesis
VRLIYDLSSLARWTGSAVGIVRTDREFALWARANLPDTVFAFFDPDRQRFRAVKSTWIDALLGGEARIDLLGAPSPQARNRRRIERIPRFVRPVALWVLQSRRKLLASLELIRLRLQQPALIGAIERLQAKLMSRKHRADYFTMDGRRLSCPPPSLALGPDLAFAPGDRLFSAGFGWAHLDIDVIRHLKTEHRLGFTFFCYDIIPLMFPEFYKPHDVEGFREHYHAAVSVADLIIFSAKKIEADARAYFQSRGLTVGATAVVPLGANAVHRSAVPCPLPAALAPGHYALFVSTIEPRKGHGMLYRVWRRLVADGVPQASGFKLVLIGRRGWMVEELLAQITADQTVSGSLIIMSDVEDGVLSAIYGGAAFCVYPSIYEGYGLPVVEAFAREKAVISSNGGALAEVVGALSPCLDPTDEDAWHATLTEWITNPDARAPYETAIRTGFRNVSWEESAAGVFRVVSAVGREPDGALR